LVLARVITVAALNRDESRGAHYKPDFPDRDDEHWLKTTIATFANGEIQLCYEDVDLQHVEPTLRTY
jgi:succinate dehydrogenase / fumarate reductase flavoprotein subunit